MLLKVNIKVLRLESLHGSHMTHDADVMSSLRQNHLISLTGFGVMTMYVCMYVCMYVHS